MLDAPPSSRAHIFILGHAGLMSGSKTSSYIRAIVLHKARHHSMQLWPCLFRWFRQWEMEADVYSDSNFNRPAPCWDPVNREKVAPASGAGLLA